MGKLSDEEAENVRRVLKEQGKLPFDKSGVLESEAVRLASVQQEIPIFVMLDAQLLIYEPFAAQKEWNVTDVDMLLIIREGTGELFMNGRKVALHYGLVIHAPSGSGMHVVNTSSRDLHLDRIAFEVLKKGELPVERGAYQKANIPAIFQEPIQLQTPYRVLNLTKELDAIQLSGEPQDYKTYLHYDPISILGQADLIADMLVKNAK